MRGILFLVFFYNYLLILFYVYVYVLEYLCGHHVSAGALRSQERTQDSLQLESQVIVNRLTPVLGTQPESSVNLTRLRNTWEERLKEGLEHWVSQWAGLWAGLYPCFN